MCAWPGLTQACLGPGGSPLRLRMRASRTSSSGRSVLRPLSGSCPRPPHWTAPSVSKKAHPTIAGLNTAAGRARKRPSRKARSTATTATIPLSCPSPGPAAVQRRVRTAARPHGAPGRIRQWTLGSRARQLPPPSHPSRPARQRWATAAPAAHGTRPRNVLARARATVLG
jgi:hypothetical protein